MRKIIFFLTFISTLFVLTGCNSWEEQKAKRAIDGYYHAIIDKDYDKAFVQIVLFSNLFEKTEISNEEAKKFFLEKMAYAEEQHYEMKAFKILEVEYEDGHSFWHHIEVEGEIDGQPFTFNEVAILKDGKLIINSEDPFLDYRNGNMDVEF